MPKGTKRELLIDALSDMLSIQLKLETEIKNADEFTNKEKLPEKLEAVNEEVKNLVHILDVYFSY